MSSLSVELIAWDDNAALHLTKSAGDDLAIIADEVKRGEAKLWRCKSGDKSGYMVTRLESNHTGDELVLVLGEGKGFDVMVGYLVDHVLKHKITLRVHVFKKALQRMFLKYGFQLINYQLINKNNGLVGEYVLRFESGR